MKRMVRTTTPTLRHTSLTSTAMSMPSTVCTMVVAAVKTSVTISARWATGSPSIRA